MLNWMDGFSSDAKEILRTEVMTAEITRLSYIDGYARIKRTTPMILAAIERLNLLRRPSEARFWIEHLGEEAFHDRVMRSDLTQLLGGSRKAAAILKQRLITPPSVVLLGYFEWHIEHGNPSLLIALRLFLEWYVSGIETWRTTRLDRMVPGGSRIIATHTSLDKDHVRPCLTYIGRYCQHCRKELMWSIEFVGRCLREAQAYLAASALECSP